MMPLLQRPGDAIDDGPIDPDHWLTWWYIYYLLLRIDGPTRRRYPVADTWPIPITAYPDYGIVDDEHPLLFVPLTLITFIHSHHYWYYSIDWCRRGIPFWVFHYSYSVLYYWRRILTGIILCDVIHYSWHYYCWRIILILLLLFCYWYWLPLTVPFPLFITLFIDDDYYWCSIW